MSKADKATPVRKLLDAITEQSDEIEDMLVIFSRKAGPGAGITIGATGHTTVFWSLGALDYARWHLYSTMSANQMYNAVEMAEAAEEFEALTGSGVKPS